MTEKTNKKSTSKKTTKEEVHELLGNSLPDFRAHSEKLDQLLISLERTRTADVALSTVDELKSVLAGMENVRKKAIVLRDTLTSRCRTRLNGGD